MKLKPNLSRNELRAAVVTATVGIPLTLWCMIHCTAQREWLNVPFAAGIVRFIRCIIACRLRLQSMTAEVDQFAGFSPGSVTFHTIPTSPPPDTSV